MDSMLSRDWLELGKTPDQLSENVIIMWRTCYYKVRLESTCPPLFYSSYRLYRNRHRGNYMSGQCQTMHCDVEANLNLHV